MQKYNFTLVDAYINYILSMNNKYKNNSDLFFKKSKSFETGRPID